MEEKAYQGLKFTVCGTFKQDLPRLRSSYEFLREHCNMVAPEDDSFLDFNDQQLKQGLTPQPNSDMQRQHICSIERSDGVWLHAPDGYVGTSTAFEIGAAFAYGIPVYTQDKLEPALQELVVFVDDITQALPQALIHRDRLLEIKAEQVSII